MNEAFSMDRLSGAIIRLMKATGLDDAFDDPRAHSIISEIADLKDAIVMSNALRYLELKKSGVTQHQLDEAIAYVKRQH